MQHHIPSLQRVKLENLYERKLSWLSTGERSTIGKFMGNLGKRKTRERGEWGARNPHTYLVTLREAAGSRSAHVGRGF